MTTEWKVHPGLRLVIGHRHITPHNVCGITTWETTVFNTAPITQTQSHPPNLCPKRRWIAVSGRRAHPPKSKSKSKSKSAFDAAFESAFGTAFESAFESAFDTCFYAAFDAAIDTCLDAVNDAALDAFVESAFDLALD